MAKQLPLIKYKGTTYFKDDRLRQIRQVDNPHNFKDFSEVDWDKVKVKNPVEKILEDMFL